MLSFMRTASHYLQSKYKGSGQELIHIPHPPSVPKGKEVHTQNLTNAHKRHVHSTE